MVKIDKIQLSFVALLGLLLVLLGSWWLYLINRLAQTLNNIYPKLPDNKEFQYLPKVSSIILWEGSFFFILILILIFSIVLLLLRDKKKTRALSAFFASLTHELKTPLASIKLQSEVINNHVQNYLKKEKSDDFSTNLPKLCERLNEDTEKLETQMDKILQLSRVENDGKLNITPKDLSYLLEKYCKSSLLNIQVTNEVPQSVKLLIDELAFSIIFKNLFENSLCHTNAKQAQLVICQDQGRILFSYQDQGKFHGKLESLASLFYKHNSTKGSGIGLYLIKKLVMLMNGEFNITLSHEHHLNFKLWFRYQ